MPAQIMSALPEQASLVAKIAGHRGAGDPGPDTAAASGDGPNGAFSALFTQLLGPQPGAATDSALLASLAEPANDQEGGPTAESLNALLPFLEAMGFAQADGQDDRRDAGEDAGLASAAILAAPLTPPASGEAAIPAAGAEKPDALAPLAASGKDAHGLGLGEGKEQVSAGREFSAQLVAAIHAGQDEAREPGSTAATVHQIIAAASPRQDGPATSHAIEARVGSAPWNEQVGNRVVWMANQRESHAELVLTPPEMGRVEVRLSVTGDQATASFVSANPQVREALEAALPRLREILADAGVQLGQAQVGAENTRQSAQQEKNGDNPSFDRGQPPTGEALARAGLSQVAGAGLKLGRGLVDVFA